MIKKTYYLLTILFGVFISFVVAILLDIYINADLNTDIINFRLTDNKILLYSMKTGINDWSYETEIYINKQGFRDADFDTKSGNVKVMCLGDSTTFGGHIDEKLLYTSKLSVLLGEKYSVYNLGVDGYNIIQEAENLKVNGLKYNPDIVLVIFCLNDFDDNDFHIYYAAKANSYGINNFLYKSKIYRRFICLPIMKLIDNCKDKNIMSPAYMYRKYGEIDVSDVEDEEIGVKVFSQLQKQYGFKCYFFILPYFKDFDNYSKEYEYVHNKIKKILTKYNNIKWFDLKEDFMNISKNADIFVNHSDKYIDIAHPNEYGNELIARFIYDKLKSDGALKI